MSGKCKIQYTILDLKYKLGQNKDQAKWVVRQENCRMAGASAGLAPGTIGRIGRSAHVHFFLLARG